MVPKHFSRLLQQMAEEQATKDWVNQQVNEAVDKVRKDLKQTDSDVDDVWSSLKRHKEATRATAKLAVYTARDVESQQSRNDLVVYLSGDLKKEVWDEYKKYKKAVADKKKVKEEAAAAHAAADEGAALAAQASAMDLTGETRTWKAVFAKLVLDWCAVEVAKMETPPTRLATAVTEKLEVQGYLEEAVVFQRFHKTEPPEEGAWAATLAFDGGTRGRLAYDVLKHGFKKLYTKGGQLGVGSYGGNKDRPLTAEVAAHGEVPVREGAKGKGKGKVKGAEGPVKRRSPDPSGGRAGKIRR